MYLDKLVTSLWAIDEKIYVTYKNYCGVFILELVKKEEIAKDNDDNNNK